MKFAVFACLVQAALWTTGDSYTITSESSKNGNFDLGGTFTLRCHGQSTAEENLIPMFAKNNIYIGLLSGSMISEDENVFPYAVVTASTVDTKIEELAPGRYTVTGSHDATSYDYTYTISDLEPMDTGNYSCAIKLGENGETKLGALRVDVLVVEPISKMAIVYNANGQGNTDLKNNAGLVDNDGVLTYATEDPAGKLACMVQYSTSLPYDCKMELYDPNSMETITVTDKFSDDYAETTAPINGPVMTVDDMHFFLANSPTTGSPVRFGFEDSGKTLKCSCKSEGIEELTEVETVLDIQFAPTSPMCIPGSPPPTAPVGHKNFTLMCYTRANPAATVAWMANNAALRSGITVHNRNEGAYLISLLAIDEVQDADFTEYKITATNSIGSTMFPAAGDPSWEIVMGDEVNAADPTSPGLPWNIEDDDDDTNSASMLSISSSLLASLILMALFL